MAQDEIIVRIKDAGMWKIRVLNFICKLLNIIDTDDKDADHNLIIKMYVKDKK